MKRVADRPGSLLNNIIQDWIELALAEKTDPPPVTKQTTAAPPPKAPSPPPSSSSDADDHPAEDDYSSDASSASYLDQPGTLPPTEAKDRFAGEDNKPPSPPEEKPDETISPNGAFQGTHVDDDSAVVHTHDDDDDDELQSYHDDSDDDDTF
eukprot:TRINITY_DN17287_c0_g1_i1.p1 TRINITY_DN17287_c0_g1~~TRINITY_DN17287_c0_g1_i1.p1  ORF type:complete len:152 (+),score=38.13 TRINITY_DN17287_c0_g1_i1:437-892(+)